MKFLTDTTRNILYVFILHFQITMIPFVISKIVDV